MKRLRLVLFAVVLGAATQLAFAYQQWMQPLQESVAFKQYQTRPKSELSKLLFLIERFGNTDFQILYDGHYYSTRFAKQVARFFLVSRYEKEKAEKWILKWCNKTVFGGNLIWVKFPDGSTKLARELLMEELKVLDDVETVKEVIEPSSSVEFIEPLEVPLPPDPQPKTSPSQGVEPSKAA